jgi:hypothetical protein
VTSLSATAWPAQALYEEHSCARGDMENGIKEQLMLFSDRTSTHYLRSNQLRLYFSSIAYVLLQMLRRLGLAGTELLKAPLLQHWAQGVEDRRADPHHGAQGVDFASRWVSPRRAFRQMHEKLCAIPVTY